MIDYDKLKRCIIEAISEAGTNETMSDYAQASDFLKKNYLSKLTSVQINRKLAHMVYLGQICTYRKPGTSKKYFKKSDLIKIFGNNELPDDFKNF